MEYFQPISFYYSLFLSVSVVITGDNNKRHSVRVTLNMRSYKYSGGVFIKTGHSIY